MVDLDRLGVLAWPTGGRLNPLLARIGRSYAAWRVGRDLDGMHVGGHVALQQALEAGPVLIVANHVAWWDGLVALALGQALGAEVGLVARGDTLSTYPWMRSFGVFPLHGGLRLRASLRQAGAFLDQPRRMLWYFPQGRQRPDSVRPLGFQPGVAAFARGLGAAVVPTSLAYPFREVEVPAAALVFGRPVAEAAVGTAERGVVEGLAAIQRWADGSPIGGDPTLHSLFPSRRQPAQLGAGARLLAGVLP